MPRPKRTLAEVDTNAVTAPAAKKALTRGKAKGKENEVPVTKKAPVAKAATKKPTASKAKKAMSKKGNDNEDNSERIPLPLAATMIQNALAAKQAASDKARGNETDSSVSQNAPTVEIADPGGKADAEPASVMAATAVESYDNENNGSVMPKSTKPIPPSTSKGTTKAGKTKKAATSSKAKPIAKDENGKVSERTSGKTWICICRPSIEIEKARRLTEDDEDEDDEIEDDEDEDYKDAVETCGGGKECLCFKLADDYPEHKWIITKKGFELQNVWLHEADKRCPDNFDMYIFNDFYGYGICEVIENMFLAFAKEHDKLKQDPMAMWSIMEGMVLFLRNCDQMPWHMIEDSEGNAKRVMLIGTALLTTIDVLIEKGIFANNSKIRNIGLILSMFLQFAVDESDTSCNEDGWKAVVVEKADAHGVTIQGLVGIEELVQDIKDNAEDSDSDEEDLGEIGNLAIVANCYQSGEPSNTDLEAFDVDKRRSWKHYDWEIELEAYRDTQAFKLWDNGPLDEDVDIGGKTYDLTAKHNKGPHMKKYKLGARSGRWF